MARLPQPGADQGQWGNILNDFLLQSHNSDGSLKSIDKSTVGLGNVDNTADANKPISTATQTALDGKAATAHTHGAADISSGIITPARLGSGTADTTTFLRGDGVWDTPPGGGTGSVIYTGNGLPANGTGSTGNYYLDKQNNILYGPKVAVTGDTLEALTGAGDITTFSNSSANDIILDKPTNTTDNDVLIAVVNHRNEGTAFTTPANWTRLVPSNGFAGSYGTWAVYYLPVDDASALPSSWTWTAGGGPWRSTGILFRVTGADINNPIHIVGDSNSGNPAALPSITTTIDNTLLIASMISNEGQANSLNATGMTEIAHITTGAGSGSTAGALQQSFPLAGATGTRTIITDVGDRAGLLFAIKGAGSSPWVVAIRGVPKGGVAGQVLAKSSNTDFDVSWVNN